MTKTPKEARFVRTPAKHQKVSYAVPKRPVTLEIPYGELPTNPIVGPGKPVGDAVRRGAEFVGDMLRNYPEWMSSPFVPAANWMENFFDAFGQSPMGNPPLPFEGGQCPIRYDTVWAFKVQGNPLQTVGINNVLGPIRGPFSVGSPPGVNNCAAFTTGDGQTIGIACNPGSSDDFETPPYLQSISPTGGGSDDCGDPPPKYEPRVPPPDLLVRNVPITISPDLDITVPIILVRPDININVDIPIQFNFNPTVQLPDLNLEIRFGPDKVVIQPYIPPGGGGPPRPPDPRSNPPGQSKPPPVNVDCPDYSDRFDAIDAQLDEIEDCACEDEEITVAQVLGGGTSGVFPLPAKTFGVELVLTVIPSNAKMEAGNSAPDVYYAGWSSYGSSPLSFGERMPISYERNWYRTDLPFSHFSFTCRVGYTATATAYFKQPV